MTNAGRFPVPDPEEWDAVLARALAIEACAAADVSSEGLRSIRVAKNAVFAVDGAGSAGVVVRVCGPGQAASSAIQLAYAARSVGVPALVPLRSEAIVVRGHEVSFWPRCRQPRGAPDTEWLGGALRRLHDRAHDLAMSVPGLPSLLDRQLGGIALRLDRIAAAGGVDGDALRCLRQLVADIVSAAAEVTWERPVVLHGDAHAGNVLVTPDGHLALADFDHACMGAAAWDQVPLDVEVRHFDRAWSELEQFRSGYGRDCSGDPGYELLVSIREVRLTTWLAELPDPTARVIAELAHRLDYWRGGRGRWRYQ